MLVVISDLHLNDEGNRTISPRAFEIFRDRVVNAAMRVRWEELPANERFVDIVLNGDILDYIRSEQWQSRDRDGNRCTDRPWDLPGAFPPVLTRISNRIIQKNRESLHILKALTLREGLPEQFPADVSFRIHYLAGNHDWFLVLPSSREINAIRGKVIDAIGLHPDSNSATAPFPHDPLTSSCAELLDSMRRHRVFVRHGDVHDPMNYPGERGRASIGDAIVVEVLGAIAPRTDEKIAGNVREKTRKLTNSYLREIDNLRPYSTLPRWLESLINTLENSPEYKDEAPVVTRAINNTFKELARNFRKVAFVRNYPGMKERVIAQGPTFVSSRLGIRLPALQEFLMAAAMGQGRGPAKYAHAAYEEQWIRQGIVDTVVYGHTHTPEVIPLDLVRLPSDAGGEAREWTYVNSGTWRPVQQRCAVREDQHEFTFSHTMTHATFYTPRERKDHSIDFWTGVLSDVHFPTHADRDMFLLEGTLVSKDTRRSEDLPGSPGEYRVVLHDIDVARHDLLGQVIPNPDWRFSVGFFRDQFTEPLEGAFPEPRIEVFRSGKLVATVTRPWPPYSNFKADIGEIEI